MSDTASPSTAFARYHLRVEGRAFAFACLIISSLLFAISVWSSGIRSSGLAWQFGFVGIFTALLPLTYTKLKRAASFDLIIDPHEEGLLLDDMACRELTVEWRGPVAFLLFDRKVRKIACFPDAERRREFKLALVHSNTTLRNQSVAT